VDRLERFRRPKGTPFFMIWGRSDSELTDAISKAKANGDLQVGDKFDAKIWINPTEPPPSRLITLAEMEYDELAIIAGPRKAIEDISAHHALVQMTDADLSDWYANNLPSLV
jgi:hypothetical protein